MARIQKKHIFLIDDDPTFIAFLQRLLDHESLSLLHCTTGAGAIEKLEKRTFDLLMIDYQLPDMLGLEILEWLNDRPIDTPSVMITGFATVPLAVKAMKLGASDVVCKPLEETDKFVRFINRTLALDPPLPVAHMQDFEDITPVPSVSESLAGETRSMARMAAETCPDLTRRETEVLEKIISGLSNKEIGSALHICERTVKNHTSSIYRKFAVDSRPKLFLKIMQISRG
ncbi:MAG: response regulator transcription factor [Candidatus Sumerlaeota bacterium]